MLFYAKGIQCHNKDTEEMDNLTITGDGTLDIDLRDTNKSDGSIGIYGKKVFIKSNAQVNINTGDVSNELSNQAFGIRTEL